MVSLAEINSITGGAHQTTAELHWLVTEHLLPLKPKTIVEIGVAAGGSSRLFLSLVGEEGRVIGVDLSRDGVAQDVLDHPNFTLVHGDSSAPETLARVRALVDSCDFLLIDGDHRPEGVLKDSRAYLPLLRKGGLAVWHDIQQESYQGIKQVWYHQMCDRLPGAVSHFDDPYLQGFGVWTKDREVDWDAPLPDLPPLEHVGNPWEAIEEALAAQDYRRAFHWTEALAEQEATSASDRARIAQLLHQAHATQTRIGEYWQRHVARFAPEAEPPPGVITNIQAMLYLDKFAEAYAQVEALSNEVPQWRAHLRGQLIRSLFWYQWASVHHPQAKAHLEKGNAFASVLETLSKQGCGTVGLAPAGSFSRLFLQQERTTDLLLFDGLKAGQEEAGVAIHKPEEAATLNPDIILVTSTLYGHLIKQRLIAGGYPEDNIRHIVRERTAYVAK